MAKYRVWIKLSGGSMERDIVPCPQEDGAGGEGNNRKKTFLSLSPCYFILEGKPLQWFLSTAH